MNNISSVVITAKEENIEQIKAEISKVPYCSVELCEDGKIVALIEAENLDSELKSYKILEKIPNIISINMVFSYQDLDEEIEKAINSGAIQTIEKNENAENIKYYGNIYNEI